ncbi:MAG: response regulator [Candidatus Aureabacteria bacterium]|nr:response regulator [Candidatus Auribacterota bacterium]
MSKRILIIDDDPDFVQAVVNLLEANNYEVATANNGENGLSKAKEIVPDLITLDLMMTNDSEGFDISKKINEDDLLKDIPIIMISGVKKFDNCAYDFETGKKTIPAKAFLEKPINPEKLLSTIKQHIG